MNDSKHLFIMCRCQGMNGHTFTTVHWRKGSCLHFTGEDSGKACKVTQLSSDVSRTPVHGLPFPGGLPLWLGGWATSRVSLILWHANSLLQVTLHGPLHEPSYCLVANSQEVPNALNGPTWLFITMLFSETLVSQVMKQKLGRKVWEEPPKVAIWFLNQAH